jgi:signal transduction histidine kinase
VDDGDSVWDTPRRAWWGSRRLLGASWVSLLALGALTLVLASVSTNPGIGLFLIPVIVRVNRRVATIERRRVGRLLGTTITYRYPPLLDPGKPPPAGALRRWLAMMGQAFGQRTTYQEVGWVAVQALLGPLLLAAALGFWALAIAGALAPLYWLVVPGTSPGWLTLTAVVPVAVLGMWSLPAVATGQARLSAKLLAEPAAVRLAARVAELTATRAGALAAHGAELRRIERDLHDGTQAQLAAIALQLGLAERRLTADPDLAATLIRRARENAEIAMGELRGLVRGLYPPILIDRGLGEAVRGLTARNAIETTANIQMPRRLPAAIEAAAYFAVAEALANVTKHSKAKRATVALHLDDERLLVEITDNGSGGADETAGTGLSGIRRRVAAFDGSLDLSSPPGGPTRLVISLPTPG